MDKERFNSIIKKNMLLQGFEKTGALDYCKPAEDGETKIIVRSPDMIQGFLVGAQFADYGAYDGVFKKSRIRYYEYELLLCNADSEKYSESDIGEAVKTVINGIGSYLSHGKAAIRDDIEKWTFCMFSKVERKNIAETTLNKRKEYLTQEEKSAMIDRMCKQLSGVHDDRERNNILVCLGLEPIDPYGIPYLVETVERIKRGGFCSMTYDEYYSHKDYYDKYCEYGCEISFHPDIQRVWIRYKR